MSYFPGLPNYKSSLNSRTKNLEASATYIGQPEFTTAPDVMVTFFTDGSGKLYFEFSSDGTNWDSIFPANGFNVTSGDNEFYRALKGPRWFRVRFVNDAVTTTAFRLSTYFGQFNVPIIDPQQASVRLDSNNAVGDAFGRLRISQPTTIFDSKQINKDIDLLDTVENSPLFYDNAEISGSGTSTLFEVNKAQTTLSVSNATAGRRVRQTKMRFNYQPGKSQLVLMTFRNTSGLTEGVLRKIGQFDDNNGLFFDDNGTSYGFVVRTYTSGSPVDTRIAQENWNIDKFDGTGVSRITIDFTKTQILVMDYEWLGVGRVRMGWNIDGVTYYAHEFKNANNLEVVYMSTPNLPLRCEIENTGGGAVAGISQICATINSEGGSEDLGIIRSASTNGTDLDANATGTIYALLGIRLKAEYLSTAIKLIDFSILETVGSKQLEWLLLLNPVVAGTFTYTGETQSAIEVARGVTANTVTGGYKLGGGFFSSSGGAGGSAGSLSSEIDNAIRLGATIAGVRDTIVLCVRPVGGTSSADVEGSITWRELV